MINQELLIELTEHYLKSLISEVCGSLTANFDSFAPFGELGIDSFYVLKIIKILEADFGNLPKTLLFENFNINDLALYFVNKYEQILTAKFSQDLQGAHAFASTVVQKPMDASVDVTAKPKQAAVNVSQIDTVHQKEIILISTKEASKHPELGPLIQTIFDQYKNESSVSRGARNIAPNLFIGSEKLGYFNYSRSKNIILAYAYTGPKDYFFVLAREMYQYCVNNKLELNILADIQIESIAEVPFSATPFGAVQRIVDLKNFTLQGTKMRRLRYQVSAFEKVGECKTEEYRCGSNADIDKNIVSIIDKWCASKTMVNPLVYIAREEILEGVFSSDHRIFLTYVDTVLQNVIIISAMSPEQNGYLMDLEFYPLDMPLGGLEFAIVKIIEVLVAEGCDMLSLGATFGPKLTHSSNADTDVDNILDGLREQNIFNSEGNLQFKNKFRTKNNTIFLCRDTANKNHDSVIDIIMMIADPAKMQTPVTESLTLYSITTSPVTASLDVTPKQKINNTFEQKSKGVAVQGIEYTEPVIEGEHRSITLSDSGFNPFNVPNEHIEFDLKTDSWAQLKLPAIEKQMKHLHTQLQLSANVDKSLREIFPFSHFMLTTSGRTAEHIFCKAWPKKGVVLQNLLFPTGIFHQIDNDFTPGELPHPEVFQLASKELYKGNLDWELLQQRLAQNPGSIAFVCIEVNNNAAGGYPVSISHLKAVKSLLAKYSIPLVMDTTRILENAQFLIEQESEYATKTIWSVVHEIVSYADAVIGSLAKDFCVNKGGIIATNDAKLFHKLQELIHEEGGGLDVIDKKLIALALQNRKHIETQVARRMDGVKLLWTALKEHAIPIVQPAGGHCILIDVKQITEFNSFEYPVASFVAWMYLNTGIRAGAHSVGMQKQTALNGVVRLAIPIGLAQEQIEDIRDRLIHLFNKKVNIPEIIVDGNALESFGDVHANYTLKKYHNVSASEKNTITYVPASVSGLAQTTSAQAAPAKVTPATAAPLAAAMSETVAVSKETESNNTTTNKQNEAADESLDIAIIGMAGRYPKAKNLNEMWENLIQGKDCIEEISESRFARRWKTENMEKYRGGFIDDVDKFDSLFFNISPREAEALDPQERLFLEVAWETIEDAGYYPEVLAQENVPANIGVFVGAVWTMYQVIGAEEKLAGNKVNPNSFLWSIANRISYWMNFSGPSLTLDTACSSSLTALYLACQAIYKGECSGAIVGGVNLDLHQQKIDINVAGGAISKDGLCRTFGQGANGYVAGEGIGAVFLKPLNKAIQDKDNIHGVIKSIVVNHGGRTSGYTIPNPKAQTSLILSALDKANIDARSIGYVEAHGTGTELGDPIEITGLTNAFNRYNVNNQTCSIGSVKTNIGHLEAAAGIVGVSKVLLQMKHQQLVPSLHSATLNEFIDFKNSPFYVGQKLEEWKAKEVDGTRFPLRAGVSSFGAGGANAHVILEKYEPLAVQDAETSSPGEQIFPLSARNEEQLHEFAIRLRTFLQLDLSQEASAQQHINNIAYSLQVGKKSFDYRLAIIANTKEELVERLSQFIEGKKAEKILFGHIKNSEGITRLLNRKEKESFVDLLSQSRDPYKLAQLWIEGLLTDWQGFQARKNVHRISLPTYPFADKRHWIVTAPKTTGFSLQPKMGMHPLIDTNESTFERQFFKKTFNDKDFFIYDHLVSDIPTLPGVAYLELARKAGETAAGRKVQKIKNILWISPLTVNGSTPTETFIDLKPNGDAVQFEVFSDGEHGKKQLYSQGKISYATKQDLEAEPEFIDIEAVRARCSKVIDGKEAYPLFKSLGLGLGPSFQVLQEVYKNEHEVLGVLKIPEIRSGDFQDFVLHPSLIDGSLQAGMGAKLGEQAGEMFVPYSIGEVEILHPLQQNCFSYVTAVSENKKTNTKLSKTNIFILDSTGKILVKIKESIGVPLLSVHEKPALNNETDEFSKLYYSNLWEKSPVDEKILQQNNNIDSVLLFDGDEKLRDLYQNRLNEAGKNLHHVILVQPGESYQDIGNKTYRVNPKSPHDFIQLFESLHQKQWNVERICFAWPCLNFLNAENFYNESLLNESLEKGIYSFLSLCKSLIDQKFNHKIQLLYLYFGKEDEPQPHHDAINGFAKTLQVEHPKLSCKTLDIQQKETSLNKVLDAMLTEFHPDTQDAMTVRYEEQERYVRRIKNCDLEELNTSSLPQEAGLKEKGVYLITGGAGGLGLIFAEFLAKEYKARLVLTGRSALSIEREAKLEELRQLGAEVLYFPADVSKHNEVKDLVNEIKSNFGGLNGIIHSAGVLRDSYIKNKTQQDMTAVFAPKLYGTLHLDEATKNENLDFFVMFSSLAAVGGNAGQSDYSFANHFMDSFAARRELLQKKGERSGKTLSFNWALWADGGMKLDQQTELFFKKNLGVKPLDKAVGLEAFAKGLFISKTQIVVLEGERDKFELAWGLKKKESTAPVSVVAPTSSGVAQASDISATMDKESEGELGVLIQQALSKIAMDFLKLDADDISLDTILLDMGFDSIGLTTYANSLNSKYQLDVTPVLFFEYPSIREIARYLLSEHKSEVLRIHKPSPAALSAGASASISQPVSQVEQIQEAPLGINKGWTLGTLDQDAHSFTSNGSGAFSPARRFVERPIAIVGMSGVMPESEDLEEFWDNLKNARNMISVIPKDRWNWEDYYGDPLKEENKSNSKWGGFMKEVDKFDPIFFGISPREAEMMDPQQKIFLETVWKTIEDSGQKVSDLAGTRTGLFVGAATHDYSDLMGSMQIALDGYTASGNSHSVLVNRVSFLLNLRGPSAPLDTACSSSLIAIHRAIESIHTGSCDMAIVGGVQVMLSPAAYISFGIAGMLSSDGKCKTFDKKADGYVRGEGSGAIFLKPLSMAEADGNHVYAVIKSTAENHGGRVTALTAPNPSAQSELLIEAYEKAEIDPTTVGYIECHGTGTSLGDPIEIQALKKAFSELYKRHSKHASEVPHCGLSSVKTNIGHLETAAGIAGIFKILLAMKYKQIPATIHFEEANPYINLAGSPFYIVDKTRPWEAIKGADGTILPRRAGVSSFGFGGANAHVVLEEYLPSETQSVFQAQGPQLIILSAKHEDRLKAYAQSVLEYIEKHEVDVASVAYTLQVGRDVMAVRLGVIVNSVEQLAEKLRAYINGEQHIEGVYQGRVGRKKEGVSIIDANQSGKSEAAIISEWFASKSLSKLSEVWVNGVDLDWSQLYSELKPKRISLPTYPFARERYWFAQNHGSVAKIGAISEVLHPLVHHNTSTLRGQSYRTTFNGNEFFLADHQIHVDDSPGQKTLPAVAYLEMVRAAVAQAIPTQQGVTTLELHNTLWLQPIVVAGKKQITIALFEDENEEISYEIYSTETDTDGHTHDIIHCHGSAVFDIGSVAATLDIQQLKGQMGYGELDMSNFYDTFAARGIHYGDSLKSIQAIYQGDAQRLVHLSLPDTMASNQSDYFLHPSVMESALQAAMSLIMDSNQSSNQPILPVSQEYLRILSPCTQTMFAWVRYSRGSKARDRMPKLDIDLMDTQGKVCITIKSITFNNDHADVEQKLSSNDFEFLLDSINNSNSQTSPLNTKENSVNNFEKLLNNIY